MTKEAQVLSGLQLVKRVIGILAQLIGDANLTPGGLFEGHLPHKLLDLRGDLVPDDGFMCGDLAERFFCTGLPELVESEQAVSGIAWDFVKGGGKV
jgi:hypothetical protein